MTRIIGFMAAVAQNLNLQSSTVAGGKYYVTVLAKNVIILRTLANNRPMRCFWAATDSNSEKKGLTTS